MNFEMTVNKIILMFACAMAFLTVVALLIGKRDPVITEDPSRDCEICGPKFDGQIPTVVAFLKLLSVAKLPVSGLCSSCKISFDGSRMRRVGDYCLIWKLEGTRAINSFEVMIPTVNLTCKCNSILSGEISPPDAMIDKFPCFKKRLDAMDSMKVANDLSVETVEICKLMAEKAFNESNSVRDDSKAEITVSITNFRMKIEAFLDRQLAIQSMVARLSHMKPENVQVSCRANPASMCGCLQLETTRRLIFYFLESTLPCMVKDTVSHDQYNVLRDSLFCVPNKQVNLHKSELKIF